MRIFGLYVVAASSLLSHAALATGLGTDATGSTETFIYDVVVKTSFGTKFRDCYTFSKATLTASGLGKLAYAAAPTDPKKYYTAVTYLSQATIIGHTIAFAGFKTGNAEQGELHAVGVNDNHDSYRINGQAVPSCATTEIPQVQGADYFPAAQ